MKNFFKSYKSSLILIAAIIIGALVGLMMGKDATVIKPLGDLFINMMFMIVIPLVFFSITSAIASMSNGKRFGQIMKSMIVVFVLTGIIAAIFSLAGAKIFPPSEGVILEMEKGEVSSEEVSIMGQIVSTLTVTQFSDLFDRSNMLALIVFSIILGFAASMLGEKAKPFVSFLKSGNEIMIKMVKIIMLYAPIGLGAYFAALVGEFGPTLVGSYLRAVAYYYPMAVIYFAVFFTVYAYIAGGKKGIKVFWKNTLSPVATALGTCSSAATLPVNLETTQKMGIPKDIRETVIPLGVSLHKDGSVMGGVLKITFLLGIFGQPISGFGTYLAIIGMALLVGLVMGAIPQGGMIGEILILSVFGFPAEALPILAALSAIIDPPATALNAVGDNPAAMLVAKKVEGKEWMNQVQLEENEKTSKAYA